MERPWKHTRARRGVCGSALKRRALWEGDRREAKVRTGLGKTHRPGSQGGLRKRGPWWNEDPTSPIERASAGNSPPHVVRAAVLSRPLRAKDKPPRHRRRHIPRTTGTVQDRGTPKTGEPPRQTMPRQGQAKTAPPHDRSTSKTTHVQDRLPRRAPPAALGCQFWAPGGARGRVRTRFPGRGLTNKD